MTGVFIYSVAPQQIRQLFAPRTVLRLHRQIAKQRSTFLRRNGERPGRAPPHAGDESAGQTRTKETKTDLHSFAHVMAPRGRTTLQTALYMQVPCRADWP